MKLYPHQQKSVDEINEALKSTDRLAYQLATGGG